MNGSMSTPTHGGERTDRKGFTLLTTALLAVVLIGMAGMAVDIARMYIAKNEVQSFVDSAVLSATLELDGSEAGLTRAGSQVTSNPNRWNFATQVVSNVQTEFAQDPNGPWESSPASAGGYKYVRVTATVAVPMLFMPLVTSGSWGQPVGMLVLSTTANVRSDSAAGQISKFSFNEGLFPFSPLAHDAAAGPHYGLVPGERYTLRWAANPRLDTNTCPGDNLQSMIDLAQMGGGEERGFIESASADIIRASIEEDYQSVVRDVGDSVTMSGGAKQTQLDALLNRINQDTDNTSMTYTDYMAAGIGNGRRLVGAPVNTGYPDYRIVQIGAFFLLPPSEYNAGGNAPFCAEYVGSWIQGSDNKAVDASGAFVARLVK